MTTTRPRRASVVTKISLWAVRQISGSAGAGRDPVSSAGTRSRHRARLSARWDRPHEPRGVPPR